jgi:hypothetical protein
MAIHARRGSFWRGGAAALAVAAAVSGGCSLLLHADANQCTVDSDCAARGPAFAGLTCNAQHSCVDLRTDATMQCTATADCSPLGAGYTCSPQQICVATSMPEGSTEAEAEAAVDAGVEAEAGCNSNADCKGLPMHPEVACNVDTHTCLQLTSVDCPVVIGDFTGTKAPPTFIGAFLVIPPTAPLSHPTYLNYNLALTEFAKNTSGIVPAGVSDYRMPVAVGCSVEGDIDQAMMHLISDVHVPSIVAALPPAALSHVFTTYAAQDKNDLFVINALAADSTLTALPTQGLLWHMLGQPSDNATAYAAFLPLVEAYIRKTAPWNLGNTAPLRVATVTANATATNNLAKAVGDVLTWNGGLNVTQNGANGNYLSVNISDSTLNGTALTDTAFNTSIQAAEQQLVMFQPHVVVSFASEELSKVIQNLEIDWPGLPFYLLGPYNQGSQLLQTTVKGLQDPYANKRFAGIGVASTTDVQVLNTYEAAFLGLYGNSASGALGAENEYDAMYFAVYSLVAAGRIPNVTGDAISLGMQKLISLTSPSYTVGPADMGNIQQALGTRGNIDLIGTLGPPDFDRQTGARIGQGDVYCIDHKPDAGVGAGVVYPYDYDVLRLISPDGGGAVDGGSPFQGTFPCYPGIQ